MEILTNFCCIAIFLFLICTLGVNGQDEDPRVTTELGDLIGRIVHIDDPETNKSIAVKQFLGVPYAKPPLRNLRFRKPEPVEAWGCKLRCHTMPNACTQFMTNPFPWAMTVNEYTSENCLYMNIWVPIDACPRNKKSVFFWIHGGGWFTGSAKQSIYQGEAISALGDVIVVVINYRLGSFGFWTNNGTDAPGNVGIWDAIEALKWVNKYIADFGGDKDSITIAGESAGSVIVTLLAVTKEARGLYKRQIVQSGAAVWNLAEDPLLNHQRSQMVSERVGCANKSFTISEHPDEVTECMRRIDALPLIREEAQIDPTKTNSFIPMWGDELFPENPREIFLKGHYPFSELFIGDCGREGAFFITADGPGEFGFFGEKEPKYDREAAKKLILFYFFWINQQEDLLKQYLPEVNIDSIDWRLQASDAIGDFVIECPTVFYASIAGQTGTKVYFYSFQHRPSNSVWANWMKTTHFDEIDFIFGGPIKSLFDYPQEEKLLSKMMITHWTNFVKYGKPADDWPLYADQSKLRIYNGSGNPVLGYGPQGSNCRFWKDIIHPNSKFELFVPTEVIP